MEKVIVLMEKVINVMEKVIVLMEKVIVNLKIARLYRLKTNRKHINI